MGQTLCECYDNQLTNLNPSINISTQDFKITQKITHKLQTIQILANRQITDEEIQTLQHYQKSLGSYFIGNITQNGAQNYGVLFVPQKTLYYGNFINGQPHGQGILKIISHHTTYRGEFQSGTPNGQGVLHNEQQNFTFTGTFKQVKHEKRSLPVSGILKLHNDSKISSISIQSYQYKDAQITYLNGSRYNGFIDQVNLLPNSSGKMIFSNGDTYQGEWYEGKPHGIGRYIWKQGQFYNGEYLNGLKHGQGTLYYINHLMFKGLWKQGKRDGLGKLINQRGLVVSKGIYRNDKYHHLETKQFNQDQMKKLPREQVNSELQNHK